ncbi:hypothetical protein P3T23_002143 [Paraburkholderia sp. GAS448]
MDDDAHAFNRLRPRLQKIASRMLGSVAEAKISCRTSSSLRRIAALDAREQIPGRLLDERQRPTQNTITFTA